MKHTKLYESISGDEYHHRGNDKTQTLIIPNEIGDFDSNDVYASIESLSGGEMDERDFVEGELYNIRVVDQDGDDESFDATFKLKKDGDKLIVSDVLKDDVMESVRVSESKRFKYLKTFESFSISE